MQLSKIFVFVLFVCMVIAKEVEVEDHSESHITVATANLRVVIKAKQNKDAPSFVFQRSDNVTSTYRVKFDKIYQVNNETYPRREVSGSKIDLEKFRW